MLFVRANWRSILRSHFNHIEAFIEMGSSQTEKIAARFREINESVSSVKQKLIDYEREYYSKVLVALIEEKNGLLQEQINEAINELNSLEGSNNTGGKSSTCAGVKCEKVSPAPVSAQPPTVNKSETDGNVGKKSEKPKSVASKEKSENKSKETKKPGNAPADDGPVDVGRLDMRVGKIVEIKKHPDADSLYVEQVDIGKPNPITVVSGLVKHVPIEEMQDRLVVILCNLKPAKMRGVLSEGMVMCASTPDKVEVLRPPATAAPGDIIRVPGYEREPDALLNPKKKIFETVAPDLKTDNDLCATYLGTKWNVVGKGPVTADSLKDVNIK